MTQIRRAMVLAAGLGTRMRPVTATMPKPLVRIAGRTLLDRGLDMLGAAGVETAVVNVHYLPDQIITHVKSRTNPECLISDERDGLLDSAGGIIKALDHLGEGPFFVLNADTFWIDKSEPNLGRLLGAWNEAEMDFLLLLARLGDATGHHGGGDFAIDAEGRLLWARGAPDGLVYAGAYITHPRVFAGLEPGRHSVLPLFEAAIQAGRLHGLVLDGRWITVGTPDAIAPAEAEVERTP